MLTNLYHDRQLYNTLIPQSHESPAVGLRISRLSGSVELTLCYTTPDIHCRHRRHECDGGISIVFLIHEHIITLKFCIHCNPVVHMCIQFCQSMVRPLKTINLVLASYSDVYCRSSRLLKLATSVLSSHKYFMNPELRAKQASYFYFVFFVSVISLAAGDK